ncbi:hypothetical protein [Bradyrhizobium sp. STM 3557]|uniref:hypothetical protein n=1 Tax=Bradyrhizobium sp. STM 3557 TaxID=578920 RepID=UPI00388E6CEB
MTETVEQPRDETTGQFTSGEALSTEGLFGREAELAEHGWQHHPEAKPGDLEGDSDEQMTQAAEELDRHRGEESSDPMPIELAVGDEKAPDNLALTVEQARDALLVHRANLQTYTDGLDDAALLAEVGVDPLQEPAKPDPVDAKPQEPAAEQQQPSSAEDRAVQWLQDNPEVRATLSEHIQAESARAEAARAAYSQALESAVAVAEHAFLSQFPEFRGVSDPDHLVSIASSIQQQNPGRWQAIQQAAAQSSELLQAQAQERQAALQRELEAVRAYNAEQERAFVERFGAVDRETGDGVRSYLEGLGATDEDFAALSQTRLPAWAQKALVDAAAYNKLLSAPPKVVPKNLPPVQRPGIARVPGEARHVDLSSLNSRLSRSGSIDDAVALLNATRASRR